MHVELKEIQAFFADTRLTVEASQVEDLEAVISAEVFAALAKKYNVEAWTDPWNTPVIVRAIIAMLTSSALYQRMYSDNSDLSSYGTWLQNRGESLLERVSTGVLILPEEAVTPDLGFSNTDFYPIDDPENLDGPYFRMSSVF